MILPLLAALAFAIVLLLSAGPAHAQAECTTVSGYQVCPEAEVLGTNVSAGDLPVTGNDPSKPVVIGAVFIILGTAAVIGARRGRQNPGV